MPDVIGRIKANGKYHYFYIIARAKKNTPRSLDEVRDEIQQRIFTSKFNEYTNNLLDSLRAIARIRIDTTAIDSISLINRAKQMNNYSSSKKKQNAKVTESEKVDSSDSSR